MGDLFKKHHLASKSGVKMAELTWRSNKNGTNKDKNGKFIITRKKLT